MDIKNEPIAPKKEHSSMSNEDIAKMMSAAIAEALKLAIPAAAVGINTANAEAAGQTREKLIREAMRKTQRCAICLLSVTACGGPHRRDAEGKDIIRKNKDGGVEYDPGENHIRYYVGPKEESLFRWFQPVTINGVKFLADYYGHTQWIPKKCDIPTIISNWERNEKELSHKREAQGHGAGYVGPNGEVIPSRNQNAIGWR